MIQLKQVSKNFQRQQVLDRLDLQVIPGDRIALIGQNGAGKTTLIRSLLGQYEHQGTLRVFQKDPRIERVGVLQHVGFVPQHPPPLQMNVGELVTFADSLSEKPLAEKVFELCRELELDLREHSAKPFFKLSGGMKQKLLKRHSTPLPRDFWTTSKTCWKIQTGIQQACRQRSKK